MNSKRDQFTTGSALPVKSVYRATDTELIHAKRKLGEPGEFPFTRGIYPEIYRTRLWTMREYTGFGSAEATNRLFKFLIRQGQTGLSVAFDLPTQLALDSDNPRAEGEVGRVGVPISSVKDMEALFDGVSLEEVSTSNRIEHDVFKELARVRKLGGSVRAIENGYIQARIGDSAFRQQLDIESGKKKSSASIF